MDYGCLIIHSCPPSLKTKYIGDGPTVSQVLTMTTPNKIKYGWASTAVVLDMGHGALWVKLKTLLWMGDEILATLFRFGEQFNVPLFGHRLLRLHSSPTEQLYATCQCYFNAPVNHNLWLGYLENNAYCRNLTDAPRRRTNVSFNRCFRSGESCADRWVGGRDGHEGKLKGRWALHSMAPPAS